VWLYLERIPEDDSTSLIPYVLVALGVAVLLARGVRRVLDRN
jgi:hypothetical protein